MLMFKYFHEYKSVGLRLCQRRPDGGAKYSEENTSDSWYVPCDSSVVCSVSVWVCASVCRYVRAHVCLKACVPVCLPQTKNTHLRNREQGSFSNPTPSAGSGLWMNNGWIQLCRNRNTFHTLCKANSQSKTTTFEHLQLRKAQWLNVRVTGKSCRGVR